MILRGDTTWPFSVEFKGSMLVEDVYATWWGYDDPGDNGNSASGVQTDNKPELLACSLPMDFGNIVPSTRGAPIPRLPWGMRPPALDVPAGAHVEVWRPDNPTLKELLALIDIGPSKSATKAGYMGVKRSGSYRDRAALARRQSRPHAIDLTVAAFKRLGGDLNQGLLRVSYKVIAP